MYKILNYMGSVYVGKYALYANTTTAGVLGFAGDVIAQKSEHGWFKEDFKWDWTRSRNMGIVCTSSGPLMHFWYKFLDTRFPGKSPKTVAKKVLLDVFTGPFWYMWYVGGISLLKGHSVKEFKKDFKDKVPVIIVVDMALWPIFQTFNFALFPPQYRVLVLKSNELVLDGIYSHVMNNPYTLKGICNKIFGTNW